jgi:hypothetical protein
MERNARAACIILEMRMPNEWRGPWLRIQAGIWWRKDGAIVYLEDNRDGDFVARRPEPHGYVGTFGSPKQAREAVDALED